MKRIILFAVSALALIAIFAIASFAWQASTSTTWSSGWQATNSANVTATTSTAYLYVKAPYSTHNCTYRESLAEEATTGVIQAADRCPDGNANGTAECCQRKTWYPSIGTAYFVQAYQTHLTASDCGPTYGEINSTSWDCSSTAP